MSPYSTGSYYKYVPITYTASTTTGDIWSAWSNQIQQTTTSFNNTAAAWQNWINYNSIATTSTIEFRNNYVTTPPPETEEARAARLEREQAQLRQWKEAEAERARKREEAKAKAKKLLEENLSTRQRSDYRKRRAFTVHCTSGRRYEISQ